GDFGRALGEAKRLRLSGAHKVVAATLFTTQSITADLQKIAAQIRQSTPAPVNFMVGTSGGATVRAVFPAAGTNIRLDRQVSTAPTFATSLLPAQALDVIPGAIGRIAYG